MQQPPSAPMSSKPIDNRYRTARLEAPAWALGFALLGWLAAPVLAAAGSGQWTSVGPPAGQFSSLLGAPSSPEVIYACSSGGAVWRSADGGETWTYTGAPVVGPVTLDAVDPTASGTLYAADTSAAAGIYKSTDGATTWALLTDAVQNVAIAASAPQTLYGTQAAPSGGPIQVARSTDGGATWTVTGTLPAAYTPARLTVSPSDPNTLYVLGAPGFLRSSDGGATWGTPFSPFTSLDAPLGVFDAPGAALYIAAARPAGETGAPVYRSIDNGTTWTAAGSGLAPTLGSFVVGPSGDLYASATGFGTAPLICQIFQSTDRGATWQQISSLPSGGSLAAGAGSPDQLFFLIPDGGIQRSPDQGRTWTLPAQPPSGLDVSQVLAGPLGTRSLYVEENAQLESQIFAVPTWHSADGGETWSSLTPSSSVLARLVLDAQPGVLYAMGLPGVSGPDISVDGGDSWQSFILPSSALAIAADPLLPGKVVGLSCTPNALYLFNFGCDNPSLYLTNTFGRGWRLLGTVSREVESSDASLVRLDPANPRQAFALIEGALFRTLPGSTSLSLSPLAGPFVDLEVAPGGPIGAGAPPTLYAALGHQRQRVLFKSIDGGAHWAAASFGLPRNAQVVTLAIDPTTPTTLYLLTQTLASQQIFVSDDGAATWQLLTAPGLPPSVTTIAAAVTPPRTLLAGTATAGVFVLTRP